MTRWPHPEPNLKIRVGGCYNEEKEKTPEERFSECVRSENNKIVILTAGLLLFKEARKQERIKQLNDYLTEEEKLTLGDLKHPQYALGLQSCKTIGQVVRILQEIEREAEKRVRLETTKKMISDLERLFEEDEELNDSSFWCGCYEGDLHDQYPAAKKEFLEKVKKYLLKE